MPATTTTKNMATKRTGVNMTYFKDLELEICELDFDGVPLLNIADQVGLSVPQVSAILDQIDNDVYNYADIAADLDTEYYGSV